MMYGVGKGGDILTPLGLLTTSARGNHWQVYMGGRPLDIGKGATRGRLALERVCGGIGVSIKGHTRLAAKTEGKREKGFLATCIIARVYSQRKTMDRGAESEGAFRWV